MSIHQAIHRSLWAGAGFCLVMMGALYFSGVAVAQGGPECAKRADLIKGLVKQYHEVPVAVGVVNEGMLMETFTSPKGTWTIFVTRPDGMSCIIASGDNWTFDTSAFDAAKKGEAF